MSTHKGSILIFVIEKQLAQNRNIFLLSLFFPLSISILETPCLKPIRQLYKRFHFFPSPDNYLLPLPCFHYVLKNEFAWKNLQELSYLPFICLHKNKWSAQTVAWSVPRRSEFARLRSLLCGGERTRTALDLIRLQKPLIKRWEFEQSLFFSRKYVGKNAK